MHTSRTRGEDDAGHDQQVARGDEADLSRPIHAEKLWRDMQDQSTPRRCRGRELHHPAACQEGRVAGPAAMGRGGMQPSSRTQATSPTRCHAEGQGRVPHVGRRLGRGDLQRGGGKRHGSTRAPGSGSASRPGSRRRSRGIASRRSCRDEWASIANGGRASRSISSTSPAGTSTGAEFRESCRAES